MAMKANPNVRTISIEDLGLPEDFGLSKEEIQERKKVTWLSRLIGSIRLMEVMG